MFMKKCRFKVLGRLCPVGRRLYRGFARGSCCGFVGGNENGDACDRDCSAVGGDDASKIYGGQTDDLFPALPQNMSLMKSALRGLDTVRLVVNPRPQNPSTVPWACQQPSKVLFMLRFGHIHPGVALLDPAAVRKEGLEHVIVVAVERYVDGWWPAPPKKRI